MLFCPFRTPVLISLAHKVDETRNGDLQHSFHSARLSVSHPIVRGRNPTGQISQPPNQSRIIMTFSNVYDLEDASLTADDRRILAIEAGYTVKGEYEETTRPMSFDSRGKQSAISLISSALGGAIHRFTQARIADGLHSSISLVMEPLLAEDPFSETDLGSTHAPVLGEDWTARGSARSPFIQPEVTFEEGKSLALTTDYLDTPCSDIFSETSSDDDFFTSPTLYHNTTQLPPTSWLFKQETKIDDPCDTPELDELTVAIRGLDTPTRRRPIHAPKLLHSPTHHHRDSGASMGCMSIPGRLNKVITGTDETATDRCCLHATKKVIVTCWRSVHSWVSFSKRAGMADRWPDVERGLHRVQM
ncbi:hypothetical protein HGRIS_004679 [Hohenbuehelia grisea]|uniref:Uncharacterized protein n=1 Tax=Hohenbuehelia grisea TaxID=104357 RepID=A0ABR3JCL2_9AGAR